VVNALVFDLLECIKEFMQLKANSVSSHSPKVASCAAICQASYMQGSERDLHVQDQDERFSVREETEIRPPKHFPRCDGDNSKQSSLHMTYRTVRIMVVLELHTICISKV